ncbi:MAG: D-lactate dehydrogenase [Corynebacterium sp.]|nr:D-lactate dehydrogenase [Corynebacterium sp.]
MSFSLPATSDHPAIAEFKDIVGADNVLTSLRATAAFSKGYRFGGGPLLAVVRPTTLVQMWELLQVCVDNNFIVIPQATNTGVTGGSGPGFQEYDRPIVLISTLQIKGVHLINDAREAISLPGTTLIELTDALAEHDREPHSVIGSTSIGASVIGGIANNSGGSQIRKGPAFTREAIFARVNEQGKVELVNHLGISLGDDPITALTRLQRGSWSPTDVTLAPADSAETEYAVQLRQMEPTPARYNANPDFLFESAGCAGKIMVFAVRTRSFPLEKNPQMFYIGTNSARELEEIRRLFLGANMPIPISGEYMGRSSFDLAAKYGKDTFLLLKHMSSGVQTRMFAFKLWVNGLFSKVPGFGPTFADSVSQFIFGLLPNHLPKRMRDYRDRFEHHLLLTVSHDQVDTSEKMLTEFFAEADHNGDFFICTEDEQQSASLHRFGAASASTRYTAIKRKRVGGLIPIDVALPRNDWDWLVELPKEMADQIEISAYCGHFFCHVLHLEYVAKKGVDANKLHDEIQAWLEQRGAKLPAEHNFGRLYHMPAEMVEHFKQLDPTNTFNAGIGGSSPRKNWA